jgi:hypothetical protein
LRWWRVERVLGDAAGRYRHDCKGGSGNPKDAGGAEAYCDDTHSAGDEELAGAVADESQRHGSAS